MNLHLAEIAKNVAPGAHAVLLVDQAGWHMTDKLAVPATSPSCPCRPNARNSTRPRTSGSSCATTGYRTASSNPTTTSSIIAATHGTSSSTNRGASCPSDCAIGRMGFDQRGLVLYMRSLRQVFSCVSSLPWPASMVLYDVRRTSRRQHSGATLALTFGRRNVLSADIHLQPTCRALALSVRTRFVAEGRKRSNLRFSFSSPSPLSAMP